MPRSFSGRGGVKNPPKLIQAGKGLLALYTGFFDYPDNPVGDPVFTAINAKNVGFQESILLSSIFWGNYKTRKITDKLQIGVERGKILEGLRIRK